MNFILIKPLYSAETSVSAIINFYQVGHLTQYEQDQYIGHLITYTKSDNVVDAVIVKLKRNWHSCRQTIIHKNLFHRT